MVQRTMDETMCTTGESQSLPSSGPCVTCGVKSLAILALLARGLLVGLFSPGIVWAQIPTAVVAPFEPSSRTEAELGDVVRERFERALLGLECVETLELDRRDEVEEIIERIGQTDELTDRDSKQLGVTSVILGSIDDNVQGGEVTVSVRIVRTGELRSSASHSFSRGIMNRSAELDEAMKALAQTLCDNLSQANGEDPDGGGWVGPVLLGGLVVTSGAGAVATWLKDRDLAAQRDTLLTFPVSGDVNEYNTMLTEALELERSKNTWRTTTIVAGAATLGYLMFRWLRSSSQEDAQDDRRHWQWGAVATGRSAFFSVSVTLD